MPTYLCSVKVSLNCINPINLVILAYHINSGFWKTDQIEVSLSQIGFFGDSLRVTSRIVSDH